MAKSKKVEEHVRDSVVARPHALACQRVMAVWVKQLQVTLVAEHGFVEEL